MTINISVETVAGESARTVSAALRDVAGRLETGTVPETEPEDPRGRIGFRHGEPAKEHDPDGDAWIARQTFADDE